MTEITVADNVDAHRFEVEIDGHLAQLIYRVDGDRLVLIHTEVPDELGGRGLGGTLVRAAIDHARAAGQVIVPECPFARGWLEKHPDAYPGVTVEFP